MRLVPEPRNNELMLLPNDRKACFWCNKRDSDYWYYCEKNKRLVCYICLVKHGCGTQAKDHTDYRVHSFGKDTVEEEEL